MTQLKLIQVLPGVAWGVGTLFTAPTSARHKGFTGTRSVSSAPHADVTWET